MSKWLITFLFTFIAGNGLLAQNVIEIKGTGPDLFIEHTVSPKESFYSMGRLYNIEPKEIAAYNNINLETPLNIGQLLRIPLLNNNFTQDKKKAAGEVLIPVYHTVQHQETLYRLGVNYNKVPIAYLKSWNKLRSENLEVGTQLVVGFLKVDKGKSSLAANSLKTNANAAPEPVKEEVVKENNAEIIVKDNSPVNTPNEEVTVVPVSEPTKPTEKVSFNRSINFNGGYFKPTFEQQSKAQPVTRENGSAATFKSTSGWQDGKYYCFNDKAIPGTIIKITNSVNGASVYAKVLDGIPEIKQNEGLLLVLSNAAAEEIGAGENRFSCNISFTNP